jgi:hypothetical protein
MDDLAYWGRVALAVGQLVAFWLGLRWLWPRLVRWADRADHHVGVEKVIRPGVQVLHPSDPRVHNARPVSSTIPPEHRPAGPQAGD